MPYIRKLEYGGYPDPVKKGSWDKKKKTYVIKTVGGFSRQAPKGMVGLTMSKIASTVKKAVEKSGWTK